MPKVVPRIAALVWVLTGAMLGLLAGAPPARAALLPTPIEVARHQRISTSAEMSAYLDALVTQAPTASVPVLARKERLGTSVRGQAIEALVLRAPGAGSGRRLRVLMVGSLHGAAEPAGGEALLELARDFVAGDLRPLLDDLDLVLIPNANPDGRDLKHRSNANMMNLNADFVRLSQPETVALRQALTRYAPDAVLDAHESAVLKRQTLAREGYLTDFDAQFEIANNPAVPAALRAYALSELLPPLLARVSAGGLPAHRYIGEITSTAQPITNGGLTARNFRNTAGLTGALSVLVETKLDSRDDAWPTYRNIAVRVRRQRLCLESFVREVHDQRAAIAVRTATARADLAREALTLYAAYAPDPTHPRVTLPLRRLDTRALEDHVFDDHRRVVTTDTIAFPPALAITAHTARMRALLDRHGIAYRVLARPEPTPVLAARFAPVAGDMGPVAMADEHRRVLDLPTGSLLVDLRQPAGRIAALLLDPRATSSVFRYPDYAGLVRPDQEFFVYRLAPP